MTAIVLGIASAVFLGGGLVLTQFGLRYIHPLSGAAISVPSFTVVFLLLSPFLLHGQSIEWRAVPIFIEVESVSESRDEKAWEYTDLSAASGVARTPG